MNQFETFLQLHHNSTPVLVANCWDVGSAKLLEENGFAAIATSSAAVAHTMGYEDGEKIPFTVLLGIVKRIKQNISVPFSVDIERGFSDDPKGIIQNIEQLHDIGIAGFNIEDSSFTGEKKLQPVDSFKRNIAVIANHLSQKNMNMYINARTDAFLLGLPTALDETLHRITAYENSGAHGIFVPFIINEDDISSVVRATNLPVNVLVAPRLPGIEILSKLGVKRISMGTSLYNAAKRAWLGKIKAIKEQQSFDSLF